VQLAILERLSDVWRNTSSQSRMYSVLLARRGPLAPRAVLCGIQFVAQLGAACVKVHFFDLWVDVIRGCAMARHRKHTIFCKSGIIHTDKSSEFYQRTYKQIKRILSTHIQTNQANSINAHTDKSSEFYQTNQANSINAHTNKSSEFYQRTYKQIMRILSTHIQTNQAYCINAHKNKSSEYSINADNINDNKK
jgi:hypothetical protein